MSDQVAKLVNISEADLLTILMQEEGTLVAYLDENDSIGHGELYRVSHERAERMNLDAPDSIVLLVSIMLITGVNSIYSIDRVFEPKAPESAQVERSPEVLVNITTTTESVLNELQPLQTVDCLGMTMIIASVTPDFCETMHQVIGVYKRKYTIVLHDEQGVETVIEKTYE